MNFEDKMARLNEIVKLLENDKLPLKESLDLYKEGAELSADCKKMLEDARLTVITMNGDKEDE